MNETPAVDIASTSAPGKLCRTTASTYCEMAGGIRSLRQEAVLRPLRMERVLRHPGETASGRSVGRLGEVDAVVDAVLYLENAGFVTGEILHVDGG